MPKFETPYMRTLVFILLAIMPLSACDLVSNSLALFDSEQTNSKLTAADKAHLEWSYKRVSEWIETDGFAKLISDEFSQKHAPFADGQRGYSEGFEQEDIIRIGYGNVHLESRKDANGGEVQTLKTRKPVAHLTRDWFIKHRDIIGRGFEINWETDTNPESLIEEYWMTLSGWNIRIELTLREDGTVEKIVYSDPN